MENGVQTLKNAVMIVQELCVKVGQQPKFVEESSTNPTAPFRSTCKINFEGNLYTSIAEGTTKKGAKLAACENMVFSQLSQVLNMNDPDVKKIFGIVDRREEAAVATISRPALATQTTNVVQNGVAGNEEGTGAAGLVVDELSEYAKNGNPIADLMVFCENRNLPAPKASDGPVSGPPHRRILSVKFKVETINFEALGVHLDKKKAKRISAEKMLAELKRQFSNGLIARPSASCIEQNGEEINRMLNLAIRDLPESNIALEKKTNEEYTSKKACGDLRQFPFGKLEKPNLSGPAVTKLKEFSIEVNTNRPLDCKPEGTFLEWLVEKQGGVDEFFEQVANELSLDVTWPIPPPPKSVNPMGDMIILNVEIPGLVEDVYNKYNRVMVRHSHDIEKGMRDAKVEFLMYLGLIILVN